jgi:lysophospholipase L1-like esterase
LDGLAYGRVQTVFPIGTDFNSVYPCGLTSIAGYWFPDGTASVENLKVNTTPFTYTAHPEVPNVMIFGDSFTTQGAPNHAQWLVAGVKAPWLPGPGFASGGVVPATGGTFGYDVGYLCQFFRVLSKGGFLTVNDKNTANRTTTSNQAVSGLSFSGTLAYITPMTTVPKLCIIGLGTNDIAASRSAVAVRADLRAIVDALVAKGAQRIVLWIPPSLRNAAMYQTAPFDAVQTAINAEIAAMPAYNNKCFVVDLFTYFGGFTPDPTKFQAANIHPNELGSTEIGQLMGAAAVAALLEAR